MGRITDHISGTRIRKLLPFYFPCWNQVEHAGAGRVAGCVGAGDKEVRGWAVLGKEEGDRCGEWRLASVDVTVPSLVGGGLAGHEGCVGGQHPFPGSH